ncbi:MAG: SPOR domain-containing protein [Alphaproteobacteria bacterium]|nr:SPOR domain-containing protein [Alphaproteobacteria bacterium]
MKKIILFAAMCFALAACAGKDGGSVNDYNPGLVEESLGGSFAAESSRNAYLLAAGPRFHVGGPYRIENLQYTPSEEVQDNEIGIAGIIPMELRGVQTTNGEVFNPDWMLATSKVLPLPSIVRVTNLENGRSELLRVNNRGPFVNNRMMDVSPAAARSLGMTGPTRIQVQIMVEESRLVKNATLGVSDEPSSAAVSEPAPITGAGTGPYTVQAGAYFSEESANALARRIAHVGNATVVPDEGMFKVRIIGLDTAGARSTLDTLRRTENISAGLLENGRWVNADNI